MTTTTPNAETIQPDESLMRALNVTEDDLRQNRAGVMSQRQREWLRPSGVNPLVLLVMGGHVLVLGGLVGAIGFASGAEPLVVLVIIGVVTGMFLLPLGMLQMGVGSGERVRRDVLHREVKKLCGAVTLTQAGGQHRASIDGKGFAITLKTSRALRPGERYCFYYAPFTGRLLAAERV